MKKKKPGLLKKAAGFLSRQKARASVNPNRLPFKESSGMKVEPTMLIPMYLQRIMVNVPRNVCELLEVNTSYLL